MSRSIKYGINVTRGNLATTNIVSTNATVGGIRVSDITVGNINFTGNLYQNGAIYVSGTGGGNGVSSQWTSTNGNLYYSTTAGNSFVGINTSNPTSALDVIGSARFSIGLTTGTIMATGLVSAGSINSTTISSGNLLANNVRGTNVTATNINISTASAGTIMATNSSVINETVTNMNISVATVGSLVVNDSNATNSTSTNLVVNSATIDNIQASNMTIPNVSVTNVTANNIVSTNSTISNIISTNVSVVNYTTANLISNSVSSANLNAVNITVSSMSIVNASASNVVTTNMVAGSTTTGNVFSTNMVVTNATVSNVISTNLAVTNISTSNILGSNVTSTTASVGNINATSVLATNVTVTNATVANIASNNIATANETVTNLVITNATASNVVSTNLSSTNISTNSILSTNISAANATITNATVNNLVSTSASSNNLVSTNINTTNITANNLVSTAATVGNILSSNIISTNASIGSVVASQGVTAANMVITSNQNQSLMLANLGASGAWAIGANNTALQYQVGGGASGSHVFYTNSTTGQSNEAMGIERLRINGQGNVGIGTNNPGAKLHVVGNMLVNGLITTSNILATNISVNSLVASGDSNRLGSIFTTGGNVGINTGSPVTKLHFGTFSDQMITLYSGGDYYGFGAGNNTVYYMAGNLGRHAFYSNSSLGNKGTEVMKVDENSKLTVTSVSTSNVNTGTLIASGVSSLQNVTATNISVNNIVITSQASLLSITTGNIDVSGDVRIKGDLYVTGSVTATNITSVNLIENNISTGTLVVSGVSSFQNLTATNITSNTVAIYNSLTAGNVSVVTAFANITSGSELGTILGKDTGQYNALYTSYKHVGDANTQNYVHYDFNGAPDVFVINGQGRVGLSTTAPSNTLHVNGDLRVNGFITTPNLIASNISTGTLIASGSSNLQNVTATNETLATLIATTGVTTTSLLATGLVSTANLVATTATLPSVVITNATVSSLTATGTSVLQNVTATNVSASSLTATGLSALQNVTSTNVSASTLTVTGLSNLQNVTATNETLATLVATTGITTVSLLVTGLVSAANLVATTATLPNLVLTNVTASNLTATGLSALQNVTATNVSASTLTASGLSVLQNVTSTNVSASTLTASGLSNLQNVTATNETLATLVATTGITTANLLATGLISAANLHATNTTLPNINITNATVSTLTVSGLSNLQNVTATNMTVSSVLSTLVTTTNLISTNVTTGAMFIYNSATVGTVFASRALANITSGSRVGSLLGKNTSTANGLYTWYEHVGDFNSSNHVHYDWLGSNNVLVLNAQGRVGMGTTAPSNTLHVVGDMQVSSFITTGTLLATNITTTNLTLNSASISNGNLLLQNNNGGGVINFGTQDYAIWGRKSTTNALDVMQFRALGNFEFWNGGFLQNQVPRMVITSVGNVGIGTTAPSNTLHVSGDVLVSGIITTSNLFATNITANGIVSLRSTRGILIGTSTNIDDGRLISALDSGMAANSVRFITFGQAASTNNQAELAFFYSTSGSTNNLFQLGFYGSKPLALQANGFVGIGTSAPASVLDVKGAGSQQFNLQNTNVSGGRLKIYAHSDTKTYMQSPGDMIFADIGQTAPRMTIATSGNIGINTASPASALTIQHDSLSSTWETGRNGLQINSSSGFTTASLYMGADATNNLAYIQVSKFGSTQSLLLNNRGGNVGIGTNNPTSTLQVNGSVSKTSGTFDIKHPLKENTRLVHSFVEGPRCDLIYRGRKQLVNGQAVVDINMECTHSTNGSMSPGTFEALCGNPQVFVGSNTTFEKVIGSVSGGELTIQSNNTSSNTVIDWMIVAERIDPDIKKWNRTDPDGYLVTEYSE